VTEPISRVEAALARLGAEHEPPAGWEGKVLAQIEQGRWWRRLLRWKIAIPMAATATAAIVIVLLIPRDRALDLALDVRKSGKVLRGGAGGADVGDGMRAIATGGDGHRAVWVYHDDRLVAACPGRSACISTEDETVAELELKLAGHYLVVALTSRSPIAAPGGAYDSDVAAAQRAGAKLTYRDVKVR
jgi:hypothetical protein